jgi:hypothetical protein
MAAQSQPIFRRSFLISAWVWAVTWGFEWPIGRRLDAGFGKPQLICVSRSIGIC